MKNRINKIMDITFISFLLIAITCFISTRMYESKAIDLIVASKELINSYSAIFGMIGIFSGMVITLFYYSVLLFMPVVFVLIAQILQLIARLFQIGNDKKWKNITSKIFSWLSIIPFIAICVIIVPFAIHIKVYMHIIPLIISIVTIYVIGKYLIKNK